MAAARLTLIALPLVTFALTAWVVRPRHALNSGYVAPRRLAVIRAAIIAAAYAVLSVEVLSAFEAITTGAVLWTWVAGLVTAVLAVGVRRRMDMTRAAPVDQPDEQQAAEPGDEPREQPARRLLDRWYALPAVDRLLLTALGALVAAELVLALASAPNTYDSQTYHLPKVEHWAAQQSVEMHAARIHRQVTFPPGAEYLLLHVRLLTDADLFYALLQWCAGLGCIVAITRIVAQLGGGRRVQLLAALVSASTPLVVLESSSTQTDLVVAGWATALVTLALDGVGRRPAVRPGAGTVVLLGLATGLIAITKTTGLLVAAPVLVWWGLAWLRRAERGRRARTVLAVAGATAAVLGLTAVVVGPFMIRVYEQWGHPLGPAYARNSVAMQRYDPPSVLVNGLRQAQTAFDLPVAGEWTASAVAGFARLIGVDPSDPEITFDRTTYPAVAWYPSEDKAAYPVQALLVVVGTIYVLLRRSARPGPETVRRAYAVAMVATALLLAATVKWQPWGNRLMLFALIVAAPMAGFAVDAALRARPTRPWLARVTAAVLAVGVLAGALSALYGWPRRLVGSDSALVLSDWESRFVMRPEWASAYEKAGAAVNASGAQRIGLVQANDTWEYPWWILFDGKRIVSMQSQAPKVAPATAAEVDAIVCTAVIETCQAYVPPGWRLVVLRDNVAYALPGSGV